MENFFKKIKFNLTLSRIVMASIIVFFAFLLLGFNIPNERHGQTRSRTKNSRNQRQKQ